MLLFKIDYATRKHQAQLEDYHKIESPDVLNEETLPSQQCSTLTSSSVTVLPETILVEQDLGQKALSFSLSLSNAPRL